MRFKRTSIFGGISVLALILSLVFASCSLFMGGSVSKSNDAEINSLSFSKRTLSLGVGGVDYLSLTIDPSSAKKDAHIEYTGYDKTIIAVTGDSSGATVSGLKNGDTVLIAKSGSASAACVVSVSGAAASIENSPYISCTMPIVELEAGTSKNVLVSLSKGSSAEMSQFSWSIDKSSIATIEASGQNGIITAKTNGIARVTVSHPSTTYPLQLLVFVKPADEKAVYLTTSQNIITLASNGADRSVSVSLVNGSTADQSSFKWEVLNTADSTPGTIALTANGVNATISPRAAGKATIRVTNPQALYPLDIMVKVVTIVDNVYIDSDVNQATVSGSTPTKLSVSLSGSTTASTLDPSQFQWTIDDSSICDFSGYMGDVVLTGKKNGMTKLTVTHPAAKYPKEFIVFVTDEAAGAVASGAYITTSQNYIRTKVGADVTSLLMTLVGGGETDDDKNFHWAVDDPSILSLQTTNGTTGVFSRAASILTQRTNGTAYITPLKEGMATIYVTHPKALTPTEVLVKVYSKDSVLDAPLVIGGPSILGLVKGTSQNVDVTLQGNANVADEAALSWASENTGVVTVAGSGKEQLVTAAGDGQAFITITNPKADNPKKILCYVADTADALAAMKVLYSNNLYCSLIAGNSTKLFLATLNVSSDEQAAIQWTSDNPSVATVQTTGLATAGLVTGVSAGTAHITATLGSQSVKFTVTVFPTGTDLSVVPPVIYLTTNQNVVQFTDLNTDKDVSVMPIGLAASEYSNIQWTSDNPSIASVVSNGATATITSKGSGEAHISVTHTKSANILKITVRVGKEYIVVNPADPFITASKDVVGLIAGAQGEQITAKLNNASSSASSLFTWSIDNSSVASISPLGSTCFIVPKSPGQAKLTIHHADATYDKNVLILVGNTTEDLAGIAYLTTTQNVVRLVTGTQQTITVRLSGTTETRAADYTWSCDNPSVLRILDNGSSAVFSGLKSGVARVTVKHASCTYPLDITCVVSDTPIDAASSPYITTSQNIVSVTTGQSKNLSVTLAGGTDADNQNFVWSVDQGGILQLTGNGQNAVVKGLTTGQCRLSVTHPKATYPFPIIVMVEAPVTSSSMYINPSVSIVSMKPGDAAQTIQATLVGGTDADKYGFTWSADNYNVVDLTYAAGTAVITPKQEGKATITITHPKSPYPATISVIVTEYSTFAFSQSSMTIPSGTTQFVSMQVPAIEGEYSGRVTYTVDNSKIVSISGTNKVAQITALASGTAIVTATSPSGAKSDMMVYVKPANTITDPYITSSTNVLAMNVTDSMKSVAASIVGDGITTPDQYNLQWKIDDPTIVSLIGTSGANVLVKPLKGGETTIRISHPKTASVYTIYVQVAGSDNGISVNKSYITMDSGKSGEISATIDNGSTKDYSNITWSADKVNGADIVSILGSGKTVALYAISPGDTWVTAEFNGKKAKCEVLVTAARQFSFDTASMRIQPGQVKTFTYTLVPGDAPITWRTNSNDYIRYDVDTVNHIVTVTGMAEGTTQLNGTANSMVASMNITCAWDYKLNLNKTLIKSEPVYNSSNASVWTIGYEVNPADAKIDLLIDNDIASYTIDKTKKEIYLRPAKEGTATFSVSATNSSNNYKFGTQTCSLNFSYSSLTVTPTFVSKVGTYSRCDAAGGALVLGDGEEMSIRLAIAETNANYTISNIAYIQASSTSPTVTLSQPTTGVWNFKNPTDYLEYDYLVKNDTYYTYNGNRISLKWTTLPAAAADGNQYDVAYVGRRDGVVYGGSVYNNVPIYLAMTYGYNYPAAYIDLSATGIHFAYETPLWHENPANYGIVFHSDPLATPIRVSQSDFKANTNYYIPPTNNNGWYNGHDGGTYSSDWFCLNTTATLIPSIDTSVISYVVAGYFSGTLMRPTGNQAFQIPVYVETRRCPK